MLDDRADLDLLDPELRRWIVYVLGVALLGLLDDALGRGARRRHRARLARPRARRSLAGRFSTGAIKAVGALALAAYATSGLGRQGIDYVADLALLLLATNLFNLLDLRPGPGREGLRRAARRALPRRLDRAAARAARHLHRPGRWSARVFTLRERAMLGDTGSNLVGALAGVAMLVTLGDTGRWIALALVAALTIFGEFRSISKTIESIPPLRWLDSLGRVSEGDLKR